VRLLRLRAGRQAQPDAGHAGHKVITDKPIIKVPGCPPIAEVMTGVITYMLTFDRLPELDRQGGPRCSTASASTTSATAARISTPVSSSRPGTTTTRAQGYCLYKMGCKGPTTYNACSTIGWNEGVLPDPVRPRLHRLFRGRVLGSMAASMTGSPTSPSSGSRPMPPTDRHGGRRRRGRGRRAPRRGQRAQKSAQVSRQDAASEEA
jgi:hypothetical protein